ncbi:PEP-CTERM sorting domain-containing protein [Duganella sp. sic0402]|uniref:PEP-CTERM sorting domain-containing protein n=1 Tax=Duganella sp. sic0402 TaxID=2854786 RepID=UPI001C43A79C|nr:PEP-CTERM sorting domain-containing protein [Duganella sp. sic0402]MBV7535954.1 PEP-CTERM sorting domain-containing protein [Duganella sp. sic0402]
MLTLKRFAEAGAVAALWMGCCMSVSAVPTVEAPPDWQAQQSKPPHPGLANCSNPPPADKKHAPTAWQGSDAPALSVRAQRVLHGGGKLDLDSYTGRCRLTDAEHDSQEPLNDGVDPEKLLKALDELDALNRTLSVEEEQALLERLGRNIQIELDSADKQLHAYIGHGINRQDLGQLARLGELLLEEEAAPRFGQDEAGYAPAEKLLQNPLGGPSQMGLAAAIPEPFSYALLLSGLALIALVRRRKGGARLLA